MADQPSRPKRTAFGSIFAGLQNGWLSLMDLLSRFFSRLTGRGWTKKANAMKDEITGQQEELQQSTAAFDDIVKNTEHNLQQAREKAGLDGPAIGGQSHHDTSLFPGSPGQEAPEALDKAELGDEPANTKDADKEPEPDSSEINEATPPKEDISREGMEGDKEKEPVEQDRHASANASDEPYEGDLIRSEEGPMIVPIGLFVTRAIASGRKEYGNPLTEDFWQEFGTQAERLAKESLKQPSLHSNLITMLKENSSEEITSAIFEIRAASLGGELKHLTSFDTSEDMLTTALHALWKDSEAIVKKLTESPEKLNAFIESLEKGNAYTLWDIGAARVDDFNDETKERPDDEERLAAKVWCEEQGGHYEKAMTDWRGVFVNWDLGNEESWENEDYASNEAPDNLSERESADQPDESPSMQKAGGINDALGMEGEHETLLDPVEGFSTEEDQRKATPPSEEAPEKNSQKNKYEHLYDTAGNDLFDDNNLSF